MITVRRRRRRGTAAGRGGGAPGPGQALSCRLVISSPDLDLVDGPGQSWQCQGRPELRLRTCGARGEKLSGARARLALNLPQPTEGLGPIGNDVTYRRGRPCTGQAGQASESWLGRREFPLLALNPARSKELRFSSIRAIINIFS